MEDVVHPGNLHDQSERGASCAPMSMPAVERERPSRHGKLLGQILAALADLGRKHAGPVPDMCATCAFREGCMTNQMASTGLVAMKCVLGVDKDRFACHHGMRDGEPSKICGGYIAARIAPFSFIKEAMSLLTRTMDEQSGPDEVREAFDAWIAEVDPENRLDDYQRGRLYLRAFPSGGARDASITDASQAHRDEPESPITKAQPTPSDRGE